MNNEEMFDVCIVGGGPAGLSAAINAWIRRKKVIVFGGKTEITKIHLSPQVDNYLGFPGISGNQLFQKFNQHVIDFEIPIIAQKVQNIGTTDNGYMLLTQDGNIYYGKTVILATGVTPHNLLEGEDELVGQGISYCATCDGPLFRDKTVTVIDYTGEGIEEAHFLAEFCRKVYYLNMTRTPTEFKQENIEPITKDRPLEIQGKDTVTALRTTKTTLETQGIFIFRETYPPGELISGLELNENAVKVNRKMETNLPGVYAAGDCSGKPYQVAKSVGEGQTAALNAVVYLDTLKMANE